MDKVTANKEEEVRSSVSSIYADLLNRRNQEREEREAQRIREKEEKRAQKEAEGETEVKKLTKKEKREAELDSWKAIVVGLTGDDLEYSSDKKSKKKKYRKWIGEDDEQEMVKKEKKPKKHNYRKEFEPELNMLKSIVADQNRFTTELQKRFQNAAGPATKDAMPLNKTLVELASAVNASRSNSLGYINAISNVKKTVADLYMKQKKMDGEGGAVNSADLALTGSNIAASLFGDSPFAPVAQQQTAPSPYASTPYATPVDTTGYIAPVQNAPAQDHPSYEQSATQVVTSGVATSPMTPDGHIESVPVYGGIQEFDPASWDAGSIEVNPNIQFEAIPHRVVVERNQQTGAMRFKAVRDDTGEELIGCPVPTSDLSRLKVNEDSKTVKGEFDESYELVEA
jgi:hypothetical protein